MWIKLADLSHKLAWLSIDFQAAAIFWNSKKIYKKDL